MDVVRAFVGHHALEVHHVAHDGVLVGDAHAAEDLARFAGHGQGQVYVVAFGHADLRGGSAAFIAQYAEAPSEQLGLGDLGDHLGQFLLGQLEATDGLAELDALLAVTQRGVVAFHGHAERTPSDAVAGAIQAAERSTQAALVRKQVALGHLHVVEHEFAGGAGAQGELPMRGGGGEAFHAAFHDQAMDTAFGVLGFGPHHREVCEGRIADPHLGPVQQVVVAHVLEGGDHAAGVAAVVGLGEAEAADLLALDHVGQPLLLLLLAAVLPNGVHGQRTLHAAQAAQAAIAALDLLHDQAVADLVQPGSAVFLGQEGAERADLG